LEDPVDTGTSLVGLVLSVQCTALACPQEAYVQVGRQNAEVPCILRPNTVQQVLSLWSVLEEPRGGIGTREGISCYSICPACLGSHEALLGLQVEASLTGLGRVQ
jgi:hypothetical protein